MATTLSGMPTFRFQVTGRGWFWQAGRIDCKIGQLWLGGSEFAASIVPVQYAPDMTSGIYSLDSADLPNLTDIRGNPLSLDWGIRSVRRTDSRTFWVHSSYQLRGVGGMWRISDCRPGLMIQNTRDEAGFCALWNHIPRANRPLQLVVM